MRYNGMKEEEGSCVSLVNEAVLSERKKEEKLQKLLPNSPYPGKIESHRE